MGATDELRRLLDERGVEYFTDDDERAYDEPARTTWDFVLCGYEMTVTVTEFVDIDGKTYLEMDFHHAFTPEQAIAATLGSEPPYDELLRCLENDWHISASWDGLRKFWCIELTEEGVKLRDATHGTLTAEQVEDIVYRHTKFYEGGDVDVQCELVEVDSYSNANEVIHVLECSACGETCEHVNGAYPRCPHCGRKAVKR